MIERTERKVDGSEVWSDRMDCQGVTGLEKKEDLSGMDGWTDLMNCQRLSEWRERRMDWMNGLICWFARD